jgi:hypothetical protein
MKAGDIARLRGHHWSHTIGDLVRIRDPEHARNRGEDGMIISLDKPDRRFVEVLWSSNRKSSERKIFLELNQ